MGKQKYTTIHDIAHKAGVSVSTVSRVLTGNTPVAEDKRTAVLHAMDRLNYRPSVMARGLVQGMSATVGVLTQNVASLFYGELVKGIEQGLIGSRYHPLVASGNWRADEEIAALDLLLQRRVDALIVLNGVLPPDRLQAVTDQQLPLIIVGRHVAGLEASCLLVENIAGARAATDHLLALGHRHIAHLTGLLSQRDALQRRAGYWTALQAAGCADPHLIVEGDFEEESGVRAVEQLLAQGRPFSAIFAANDQLAYGARLALYRAGLRVPEDVSLIGFDDQLSSRYTIPPLTTVRQPIFALGLAAAHAVLQWLAGEQPILPLFSTELVLRDSTGPALPART